MVGAVVGQVSTNCVIFASSNARGEGVTADSRIARPSDLLTIFCATTRISDGASAKPEVASASAMMCAKSSPDAIMGMWGIVVSVIDIQRSPLNLIVCSEYPLVQIFAVTGLQWFAFD